MFEFIKRLPSCLGIFQSVPARNSNLIQNRRYRPRLDVLEDRLVPASFVWQTPWEVSFDTEVQFGGGEIRVAFGAAATADGQVTDIGQPGDSGTASAVARASVHSGGIGPFADSLLTADVSFRRTFQLSDAPAGWQLDLDASLSGILSGWTSFIEDAGYATVDGTVRVDSGAVGGTGEALLSVQLADDVSFVAGAWVEKTVSQATSAERLVIDGTYTVSGALHISAYTGGNLTGAADHEVASSFFDPPGLAVTVDAVPSTGAPPLPSVAISDASVTEGNTGTRMADFTVSLSSPSTQPVEVNYSTADGTATTGADYAGSSGSITFAPGEVTKTIVIPVTGDRLAEPDESFNVNLTGVTNGMINDGQGNGTILDDEPRVSISDVTKAEGKKGKTTLFVFTVTLSAAYDQTVTMSFQTVNGTATTSDNDYVARAGTLTFAPGETTKTITIEVRGDSKREADETFYLDLFGLNNNALFTKNRGFGTIVNED